MRLGVWIPRLGFTLSICYLCLLFTGFYTRMVCVFYPHETKKGRARDFLTDVRIVEICLRRTHKDPDSHKDKL